MSVNLTSAPTDRLPPPTGFGTTFTDHLFFAEFNDDTGWRQGNVVRSGNLELHPAATVLHYGQAAFDGLKAFRCEDGVIRLFRPEAHINRLTQSCQRLAIPPLPESVVLDSFRRLIWADRKFVPDAPCSLYLRPIIYGCDPFLGVRAARRYTYLLLLSPVADYYQGGFRPLRLLATDAYARAAPGGLGAAKTPANYAASLLAGEDAQQRGFDQVLWLDAMQRRFIEEVGAMNIMIKIDGEVVTPPLSGTILPGVTRDSCLTLMRQWGLPVSERPIAIDELFAAARAELLEEVWGTGTAAIVAPVGEIEHRGTTLSVANRCVGPLTTRLYEAIRAIQFARIPDEHGWLVEAW
jgi:branched-chain amino acid aminotransferase